MLTTFPNIINVADHGVYGDQVSDDTAALQAIYDAADRETDAVYFPPGFLCRVTSTIYPRGVATFGATLNKRTGRDEDFLSGVVADIPKSAISITGSDFVFSQNSITSTSTDLSLFADGDIVVIEGSLRNAYRVGTIDGHPTANALNFREGNAPPLFNVESDCTPCSITKLIPVFEDGMNVAGRSSPDGTIFSGIGIAGASKDKSSGWAGALASTSYVIGYRGGNWNQAVPGDQLNTRGTLAIKCKHIAAGVVLTGWQNDIDIYTDHCCLGFSGYQLHAGDIKIDSDACGTHRFKAMTGGRILFHHQGSDDWWTQQAYFRDVAGVHLSIRTEGASTSQRWLEFQFLSGCHVVMHCGSIGSISSGNNHIEVNNSNSSLFIGQVISGGGAGGDIRFGNFNVDIAYLLSGQPRINGSANATKLV